jgi:hypothetical protein
MTEDMWAVWVLVGVIGWATLALGVGVLIGRSVRLADQRSLQSADLDVELAAQLAEHLPAPVGHGVAQPAAPRSARGRVPLPPVGVALVVLAIALESIGFVLRLSGSTGPGARLFSMDAPLSMPRMYIAGLFASAAIGAATAAVRIPRRRTWWGTVGLVGAAISIVKAGGTVHADGMHWLSRNVGSAGAQIVAGLLAFAVLGLLGYLARAERRDRLRVLGSLAFYAAAAVGLSAVSANMSGARAAAVATFAEEAGEALGAVVFLIAVLVGVAPRLVLPAEWALRRSADAHTLDAAGRVSEGRPAAGWR